MKKIMFRSTNRDAPLVGFKDTLLTGQAPDYGLYMPTAIPKLTKKEIDSFRNKPYWEIAFDVVSKFLPEEIDSEELENLTKDAYDFDIPLEKVDISTVDATSRRPRLRSGVYIMRLDHGPTASFKDFAARLMARLMHYFARKEDKKLTVLVATSGDTGGAVADAFYGLENISVVVLFPEKEVTGRQRKQMTTLGKNVKAIAIKGKFDDCQAFVKRAFNDPELRGLNLTSANSINFGRLMPQIVYYFYAFSRLVRVERGGTLREVKRTALPVKNCCVGDSPADLIFAVPSGNFGNLMGGVLAKEMGLPVEKFIVAVNENDEFSNFLKTGHYEPVIPSKNCSSNAMNVGHPSNLARLIDLYGGWMTDERDANGKVIRKGVLNEKPDMERLREDFVSFSITEEEVDKIVKGFYEDYKIVIEPHGAVGLAAVEKAVQSSRLDGLIVSLETAAPAKFPEKAIKLLGIDPPLPESLKRLEDKDEQMTSLDAKYSKFKSFLKQG